MKTYNVTNSSLIAKAIREKDENKIKLISGNAIILTIIISIITILIALLIKPILPTLFNVDKICNTYLIIRLVGFFQSSIVTVLSGQQRTLGKQGNILKLRIVAVVLNLVLDIVVVNYGYGIKGVAWVTVLLDSLMAIYLFIKSKKSVIYKFNKSVMKKIFELFNKRYSGILYTRIWRWNYYKCWNCFW